MKFWGWLLGVVGFVGVGLFIVIKFSGETFLNPLSEKKEQINKNSDLVTFGFLPTWMVGKTRKYGSEVSHLVFLGIESDEEGNLIWETQSKKINNEDYLEQKAKIKEGGGKNILGIKLFDDEKIEELLSSKASRNNLILQIKGVVD
jgi:hypothetical protein